MPRDTQPEIDPVVKEVALALTAHAQRLPELYRFTLSHELLSELSGRSEDFAELFADVAIQATTFDKTLTLRRKMPDAFRICDDETKKFLVRWILKWGGTDRRAVDEGTKQESINKVIWLGDCAIGNHGGADLDRVASWSKYAAFRHPTVHAILDSRVAFSLNWLLFRAGSAKFLPHNLASENTFLGLLDYWPLILANRHQSLGEQICKEALRLEVDGGRSRLVNELSRRIAPRKGAYAWYLDLMGKIAEQVFGGGDAGRLLKTEMLLFAGATTFLAQDVAGTLVPLWNRATIR